MVIKKNTPSNIHAVWKSKTGTNTVRDVFLVYSFRINHKILRSI